MCVSLYVLVCDCGVCTITHWCMCDCGQLSSLHTISHLGYGFSLSREVPVLPRNVPYPIFNGTFCLRPNLLNPLDLQLIVVNQPVLVIRSLWNLHKRAHQATIWFTSVPNIWPYGRNWPNFSWAPNTFFPCGLHNFLHKGTTEWPKNHFLRSVHISDYDEVFWDQLRWSLAESL